MALPKRCNVRTMMKKVLKKNAATSPETAMRFKILYKEVLERYSPDVKDHPKGPDRVFDHVFRNFLKGQGIMKKGATKVWYDKSSDNKSLDC